MVFGDWANAKLNELKTHIEDGRKKDAHDVLGMYFSKHMKHIMADCFSVLSPASEAIGTLRDELHTLRNKVWT